MILIKLELAVEICLGRNNFSVATVNFTFKKVFLVAFCGPIKLKPLFCDVIDDVPNFLPRNIHSVAFFGKLALRNVKH